MPKMSGEEKKTVVIRRYLNPKMANTPISEKQIAEGHKDLFRGTNPASGRVTPQRQVRRVLRKMRRKHLGEGNQEDRHIREISPNVWIWDPDYIEILVPENETLEDNEYESEEEGEQEDTSEEEQDDDVLVIVGMHLQNEHVMCMQDSSRDRTFLMSLLEIATR